MTSTSSKSKFPKGAGGYPQSSHMKSNLGGGGKGKISGKSRVIHPGFHTTKETNPVRGPRPDEKYKGLMGGVPRGHNFEQEIKETFKGGGYANIKPKAMPHDNHPIPSGDSQKTPGRGGSGSGKAEHHPSMQGSHSFKPSAATNAHGFGHGANLRSGPLRRSGHSGAHQVGKR